MPGTCLLQPIPTLHGGKGTPLYNMAAAIHTSPGGKGVPLYNMDERAA